MNLSRIDYELKESLDEGIKLSIIILFAVVLFPITILGFLSRRKRCVD